MDAKGLVTYGLIGGAAYFLYKAFAPKAATPAAPGPQQPQPGPSGAVSTSSGAPPSTSITTPTVTSPSGSGGPAAVTPASLTSAAVASGNPTMLNPDQWDWLIVNVLKGQAFNIDASFGVAGGSGRTATYSAQDFYDVATGARALPAPSSGAVTTQTCPPDCGSDPASAMNTLAQILQSAAPGISEYRPDEWNYYVNGYYDMDRLFGPVGTPARDGTLSARQFAGVVIADQPIGISGMGLIRVDRGVRNNPILRPNIPGTRRWVPEAQRYGVRAFIDSKGGWAV